MRRLARWSLAKTVSASLVAAFLQSTACGSILSCVPRQPLRKRPPVAAPKQPSATIPPVAAPKQPSATMRVSGTPTVEDLPDTERVANATYPAGVALDREHIYWMQRDLDFIRLVVLPLAGGDPHVLATGPQDRSGGPGVPSRIAVDDTHVYFSAYGIGQVLRVPKTGGPTEVFASGFDYPGDVAVSGRYVYWTSGGRTPRSGALHRAEKVSKKPIRIASGQDFPLSLALSGEHLFWTNYYGGSVHKAEVSGKNASVLARGQPNPLRIAVCGDWVCWLNMESSGMLHDPLYGSRRALVRVPLSGGDPSALARVEGWPSDIVAVDDAVYWTMHARDGDEDKGSLFVRLREGDEPRRIFSYPGIHAMMAVNDTHVYLTVRAFPIGSVYRVRRTLDGCSAPADRD